MVVVVDPEKGSRYMNTAKGNGPKGRHLQSPGDESCPCTASAIDCRAWEVDASARQLCYNCREQGSLTDRQTEPDIRSFSFATNSHLVVLEQVLQSF